jgi:PPOX class probable F420-dependent enzyme
MTTELPDGVTARLHSADYGWLTTVAKSGQPVPKLVWFYFDGSDVLIYTHPDAAKVRHIGSQPRVSMNLDSDGNGGGIIVVGGLATVDAEGFDPRDDKPYWTKYRDLAAQFGLMEAMGGYDTRLRLSIEQVWTTPTA